MSGIAHSFYCLKKEGEYL